MSALNRDAGPLVPWDTMGRDRFDRLVEALVEYQHPAGSRVDPIEGRGGDGGIDVLAIEPTPTDETGKEIALSERGRVVVYQLKYFPEGFDGKEKGRRKQITASLNRAIKTVPDMDEWVLVAPCKADRTGYAFLESLRKQHEGLTITFINRSLLDSHRWVAGHPDVARALVTREETLEKAHIYNQETSVLAGGLPDLVQRQLSLDDVTDDLDPHWTVRVNSVPGQPTVSTLLPKHPRAAEASPITVTFDVDGSHPGAGEFVDSLDYGSFAPIRIPGEAVHDFKVSGPTFFTKELNEREIELLVLQPGEPDRDPRPLSLSFLDHDGSVLTSFRGVAKNTAWGATGVTVRQEFFGGCLVIDWRIPKDTSGSAKADVIQDLRGPCTPEQVRGTAALRLALNEKSSMLRLTVDGGGQLARMGMDAGTALDSDEQLQELRILHEAADDLVYVQDQCGRQFAFPDEVSVFSRIDTRILRRLLEGRVVCLPTCQLVHLTVSPEALDDPKGRLFLTEPGQLALEQDPVGWTLEAVADQGDVAEITLHETIGYYFPELAAKNPDEVMATLERGATAQLDLGSPSRITPRLYLRDRLRAGTPIVPEPWGLLGVAEVPELRPDRPGQDNA